MRYFALLLLPLLIACEPVPTSPPPPIRNFSADIVVLGEHHGTPDHHKFQAETVARLQPAAIVFEQIQGADTAVLNGLLASRANVFEIARRLNWIASGWPDFRYYYDIMTAAPDALIIGGGTPSTQTRTAISTNAATVFGADAERFTLTLTLPPVQRATRETLQFDAHCRQIPIEMAAGFVEAQRLRDANLANAALVAREQTQGGQIVIITGNGHARTDWGIPYMLSYAAPELTTYALGQVASDDNTPFDTTRISGPLTLADPCSRLAIR